jgi:hypothetical protein
MKSKEEKIYSYVVLGIGLLFLYIYFYIGDFDGEWSLDDTYFYDFWINYVGVKYKMSGIFFFIHQIMFILFYWYIREDIVRLLKWIHNKI